MKVTIELTDEEINLLYRIWVGNTTDKQIHNIALFQGLEKKLCRAHIESQKVN